MDPNTNPICSQTRPSSWRCMSGFVAGTQQWMCHQCPILRTMQCCSAWQRAVLCLLLSSSSCLEKRCCCWASGEDKMNVWQTPALLHTFWDLAEDYAVCVAAAEKATGLASPCWLDRNQLAPVSRFRGLIHHFEIIMPEMHGLYVSTGPEAVVVLLVLKAAVSHQNSSPLGF